MDKLIVDTRVYHLLIFCPNNVWSLTFYCYSRQRLEIEICKTSNNVVIPYDFHLYIMQEPDLPKQVNGAY